MIASRSAWWAHAHLARTQAQCTGKICFEVWFIFVTNYVARGSVLICGQTIVRRSIARGFDGPAQNALDTPDQTRRMADGKRLDCFDTFGDTRYV